MKYTSTIAAVAVVASASFAYAGNIAPAPVETPVMAPVAPPPATVGSDWTGFNAGLQYNWLNAERGATKDQYHSFGLHGGYLHDFDKIVLGGEGEYNFIDGDNTMDDADLWRAKILGGIDLGAFMPYATVGYANFDGEDGIAYGVGAKMRATENLSVTFEYTRNDFNDFDAAGNDLNIDLLQLRGSYHF